MMIAKEKMKHVATPLPLSEVAELVRIASRHERKMAAEIRIAIRSYIEANRV